MNSDGDRGSWNYHKTNKYIPQTQCRNLIKWNSSTTNKSTWCSMSVKSFTSFTHLSPHEALLLRLNLRRFKILSHPTLHMSMCLVPVILPREITHYHHPCREFHIVRSHYTPPLVLSSSKPWWGCLRLSWSPWNVLLKCCLNDNKACRCHSRTEILRQSGILFNNLYCHSARMINTWPFRSHRKRFNCQP